MQSSSAGKRAQRKRLHVDTSRQEHMLETERRASDVGNTRLIAEDPKHATHRREPQGPKREVATLRAEVDERRTKAQEEIRRRQSELRMWWNEVVE